MNVFSKVTLESLKKNRTRTIVTIIGIMLSAARNVTVPFTDYLKNVASSEIYPTWPENAIRANIYAQAVSLIITNRLSYIAVT